MQLHRLTGRSPARVITRPQSVSHRDGRSSLQIRATRCFGRIASTSSRPWTSDTMDPCGSSRSLRSRHAGPEPSAAWGPASPHRQLTDPVDASRDPSSAMTGKSRSGRKSRRLRRLTTAIGIVGCDQCRGLSAAAPLADSTAFESLRIRKVCPATSNRFLIAPEQLRNVLDSATAKLGGFDRGVDAPIPFVEESVDKLHLRFNFYSIWHNDNLPHRLFRISQDGSTQSSPLHAHRRQGVR